MTLTMITEGLLKLLEANHYNPATIRFYQREWKKISSFLYAEYYDEEFEMERGLAYLEKQYGFVTRYNDGSLSQQRVQLLRVVHMLEDYRLHQVLTRRYHATKNPLVLEGKFAEIYEGYCGYLGETDLALSTIKHYSSTALVFLDYLFQKGIEDPAVIDLSGCNGYLKTLAGFSFKTVEQNVCGLRFLLRYLQENGLLTEDYASKIHMPPVSKQAKIPSAWTVDELKQLISVIDRNSPIGKRDYAMILLACVLGLRISDIKNLRFSNFDWNNKEVSLVQKKTKKPLKLPLPDLIGWAVIDYIRDGRPKYDASGFVFIKHMPPFNPLSDNDHLQQRIIYHMNKAGIHRDRNKHSGFHSLRHSAGSMMLEMGTSLPVITTVLGHSDMDITAIYLKTDLSRLAECVLPLEGLTMSREFRSIFADDFRELISVKRALGFKYLTEEGGFLRIDTFLSSHGVDTKEISRELCEEWCRKRNYESPANHGSRVSQMRVFCRYLNDVGIKAYIPPSRMTRKPPKYDAHIYTPDELRRFFEAVDKSRSVPSECPYRGMVMPVFFRILYTSGMRVSELRLARIRDVDLERCCIFVQGGKNRKDRIVPIHPELAERCRALKVAIHSGSSEDEYFFMQYPGQAMTLGNIYKNFRKYLEKAGIPHTGHGPRVHDFRHTYCTNLLLKWSREGKDLMACLPYMRTMLGHEGFDETAYYLKLTADAFPFIRDSLKKSFPSIINEVSINDREYY